MNIWNIHSFNLTPHQEEASLKLQGEHQVRFCWWLVGVLSCCVVFFFSVSSLLFFLFIVSWFFVSERCLCVYRLLPLRCRRFFSSLFKLYLCRSIYTGYSAKVPCKKVKHMCVYFNFCVYKINLFEHWTRKFTIYPRVPHVPVIYTLHPFTFIKNMYVQ